MTVRLLSPPSCSFSFCFLPPTLLLLLLFVEKTEERMQFDLFEVLFGAKTQRTRIGGNERERFRWGARGGVVVWLMAERDPCGSKRTAWTVSWALSCRLCKFFWGVSSVLNEFFFFNFSPPPFTPSLFLFLFFFFFWNAQLRAVRSSDKRQVVWRCYSRSFCVFVFCFVFCFVLFSLSVLRKM